MIGYWNGERATFKGVSYEVTEAKEGKLWWQNEFIGDRRQGIEITYNGRVWIIDNQYGYGYHKVTYGMGSPACGHKSISNPINVEYISELDLKTTVDVHGRNNEYQSNREWAKKIDSIQFKKSELLIAKMRRK